MGRRFFLAAALPVAALALSNPASAGTVAVAPSTQWNVNFGEESCRLGRLFGEGEERHALFLEQFYPAVSVSLTAAGPGFRRFRSRARTRLRFSEAEEGRVDNPFTGEVEGVGDAVIYSYLRLDGQPSAEADQERDTASLPQLDAEWAKGIEFRLPETGQQRSATAHRAARGGFRGAQPLRAGPRRGMGARP